MKLIYILLVPAILLSSCTFSSNQIVSSDASLPPAPLEYENLTVGSGETRDFTPKMSVSGEAGVRIQYGESAHVRMHFVNSGSTSVAVHLTTPGTNSGNIRVTQIVYPNGIMDGPFDRDMTYTLTMPGEYQVILGPNMMAGDPWSGTVDMEMHVK